MTYQAQLEAARESVTFAPEGYTLDEWQRKCAAFESLDWMRDDGSDDLDEAEPLPPPVTRRYSARRAPVPPLPIAKGLIVYFIGGDEGPIKIGVTGNVANRLKGIQNGCPFRVRVLASLAGDYGRETHYHRRFADQRLVGEWFERTPELLTEIALLTGSTKP